MSSHEDAFTFQHSKWDSDFFGVSCAKAILHKPLSANDFETLLELMKNYEFISLTNQNSDPRNAQLIGHQTSAFLADVNIQFIKKLAASAEMPDNISLYNSFDRNQQVIDLAEFQYSKFIEDPELAKRRGNEVYREWVMNSFNKPDKYFAISRDDHDQINGFALYSFSNTNCILELISVSQNVKRSGIATRLFGAVEYDAIRHGINVIKVGTQIRNIEAINFYHKVGCKQSGCHQVYHLWNQ